MEVEMTAKNEGVTFTIEVHVSRLPCTGCGKRNTLAVVVPDLRICWCIACHTFWQVTLAMGRIPVVEDIDDT